MESCARLAYPVATSHILMVLSLEEEMRKSPDGMNVTEETLWSCPCSVLMHVNEVKSQSLMDMSAEQEAERERKGGRGRERESFE